MVGIVVAVLLFSKFVLSKLIKAAAKSQELLFLTSFSWCLLVCAAFYVFNFPIEIGALLAGITLASTPYRFEIASKMKPLRDFFLVIFFVSLGSQLIFGNIGPYVGPIIALSLFVIIGKPLIIMTLMGIFGYRKRTSFQTAIALAQVSEFSLIFIALANNLGSVPKEIVSLITIVALISIVASSYMILHSRKLYNFFSKYLKIFERKEKGKKDYKYYENNDHEVILFGYNRTGGDVLHTLKKLNKKVLIVDYNPNTILELAKRGFDSVYGDANDLELLNDLNFSKAKMVVSTVQDFDANLLLVKQAVKKNKDIITIVISNQIDEANELYKNGATYVILPNYIGGHYASTMIEKYGFYSEEFIKEKLNHLKYLKRKSKKPKYLVYKTKPKEQTKKKTISTINKKKVTSRNIIQKRIIKNKK
jgi:Trk K+ transport system NAD-binding subunit